MRIGIDGKYLLETRRGIGQSLNYLIRRLAAVEENEYLLFYNHFWSAPINEQLFSEFENVVECRFRWPTCVLEILWRGVRAPKMEFFLGPLDVFHAPVLHMIPPTRAALVVTLHDFAPLRFPEGYPPIYLKKYKHNLRVVERYATRIIAVSQSTKADILRFTTIPEDRISIVYRGVDPEFHPIDDADNVDAVLKRLGLPRGYILYAGGAELHKNLERLLNAYARLPADLREKHALVLAGKTSWGHERLREKAMAMGLGENTIFPGYVADEDMPSLYNAASLVAFPSLCEGFGFVAVEAMACGVPVVTSNVSSLPEVVGDAGVLVNPRSVEGITEALQRALTDSALRADLRRRGLLRVREFTWEKTAQRMLKVYEAAMADGSRP